MNIDLHTHAKWSKNTAFSMDYFLHMMREAQRNGLDAVALTEHFNTLRFGDIFSELDRHCAYGDGHYRVEGVKVFPGMEVDVRERSHILLIGSRERIASIWTRLEDGSHLADDRFIGLEDLLDMTEADGCLRIGAHPFRTLNPLHDADPALLKRLDAFDLNGRDLFRYGPQMEERVRRFGADIGVPVVGGSDTHQPLQYGSVVNSFDDDCATVGQLRTAIRAGKYRIMLSQNLSGKVRSAEAEQARYKQAGSWLRPSTVPLGGNR